MLDQFAQSLRAELDFRREADAMVEMALVLGADSAVRDPEGLHASSARVG